MESAGWIFKMNQPVGDSGKSKLQHAEQFYKATGIYPEELDGPELPDTLIHIWDWFQELNQAREFDEYGPKAISFSEIQAWCRLRGLKPTPTEVRLIKKLDMQYLNTAQDGR